MTRYCEVLCKLCLLSVALTLSGCASQRGFFASSGPLYQDVVEQGDAKISVLEITEHVTRRLLEVETHATFSETFKTDESAGFEYRLGAGDVIEVSIWEAPPATLFGSSALDTRVAAVAPRVTTLPEQMVSAEGTVNVPFAGQVMAKGKTLYQVEQDIVQRLKSKANQPQALVRVARNVNSNVTVVGQVQQSQRMSLTPRGERLLDALALAGGANLPINKVAIQLSRKGVSAVMPFQRIIQEPIQNVRLWPGDVVTALYQANSFTALGATGKNDEIAFETVGISLIQALGRAGGAQDQRADARGVFVFRFEDAAVAKELLGDKAIVVEGRVPVVYQMDLRDPKSFLLAQNFAVKNKDVIYLANAKASELQKFLSILTSSVYSISTTLNLSNN